MNTEIKETTRETFKNVSQCDARCLRIIMAARKGDMDEAARLTDELQEVCRTCAKANEILGDIMDMMGADPKAVIEAYNYAIEKTVQPLSRLLLKRGIQHAGRGEHEDFVEDMGLAAHLGEQKAICIIAEMTQDILNELSGKTH